MSHYQSRAKRFMYIYCDGGFFVREKGWQNKIKKYIFM